MQALVVGGTGPTGVPIVEGLIARGYEVTIYHRGAHETDFSRPIKHIHGDPFSQEAIEQDLAKGTYDVVVSSYGRLRHVAKAMSGKAGKFVGITGCAAYVGYRNPAYTTDGLPVPITEAYPTYVRREPDAYGWAVAEVERQLLAQHDNNEFDVTVFRYPNVYGPRASQSVIWSIMKRVLDKRAHIIVPGNGSRLRSRGYIDNLAHAVLLSIDNAQSSGQIYNICDERTLTLSELIACIVRFMNHECEIVTVAHPVAEKICRGYAGESHHQLSDLSKVKRELGYRDVVAAPEAIERTVEWHLKHRQRIEDSAQQEKDAALARDPYAYEVEDRLVAISKQYSSALSQAAQ